MKVEKTYLKEEAEPTIEVEIAGSEELPVTFEEVMNLTTFTNMISGLIKDEWEAIEGYNQAIITLSTTEANENALNVLRDISSEEYIHIGQLEKLLQMVVPEANNVEEGKEETIEQVEEIIEEPEEEAEGEEALPDDDVPEDLADAINFEKKEEE